MERAFFEKLLYEGESATLDFKSEQYRFVKATDDEKSELLKDILGFANAWRRTEAYILIGVEELRGVPHNVVGIAAEDHLADHSLQQFVHNLTNRNVLFHYEAFKFEDKHVGIIRIEKQRGNIYLKQDYGKLKKKQVFVRRGSSTDPSNPASIEEIELMGQTAESQSAELVVEFADAARDHTLGDKLTWDAVFLETPPPNQIPDWERPRQHALGFDIATLGGHSFDRLNPNYLRDLAHFFFIRQLYHPVRLLVRNVGEVGAKDVRCELAIPASIGASVIDAADLPDTPKSRCSLLDSPALKSIKPAFRRTPGEVTITQNDERYLIEIEYGDLQPGRCVRSDVFYAGKTESGEFELAGHIYAENLPKPKDFSLAISATVTRATMTVDDLWNLPEPPT